MYTFKITPLFETKRNTPFKIDIPDYIRHWWYDYQISIAKERGYPDRDIDEAVWCKAMSVDHLKAIVDWRHKK